MSFYTFCFHVVNCILSSFCLDETFSEPLRLYLRLITNIFFYKQEILFNHNYPSSCIWFVSENHNHTSNCYLGSPCFAFSPCGFYVTTPRNRFVAAGAIFAPMILLFSKSRYLVRPFLTHFKKCKKKITKTIREPVLYG